MRQDICRKIDFQLTRPSDPSTYGYADHSFLSVARACDIWLKKHCPEPVRRRFGEIRRSAPPEQMQQSNEVRVHREKKPKWKRPSRKRYATEEERREALKAIVKAHWASLTPEQRAARSAKSNKGRPKRETPRWLDEKQKAYKNEWQRKRRETHPLTEEELLARREKARIKYQLNREERRAKANERRRNAKAAKKAAQEASVQIG